MNKKIEKLIEKYERGIAIHQKHIDSKNVDSISKNRATYLLNLCELIVGDLKNLIKP